ncbi:MAG: LysR substrate-binding domain-containing protein [Lautropia sp.]
MADPRSIGGVVTLGLPLSVAAILALPIIQRAKATLPLVQLHMYELSSGTGAEWLASSRLDMCLLFQEHELSGISRTVLFDEVLFLLVQSASPLARRKSIPLREVAGMRLVLPTPGLGVRSLLEDECAKLGLRLANPAAELNSISLMKQATAAGLGPSVFGAAAFSGDPFASHLSALQIVRPSLPRRALLYTREAADNEAVERVADLARATVREVAANAGWRGVTVR